jgi:uncharacterized protein
VSDDRITVSGRASRSVAPDTAVWRAEAVESDDDPHAAFERCSRRLNALVERLDAVGDVETDAVVVQPRWDGQSQAGAEAIGAVRVRSPAARAGEVAQAAMAAGADRLHGPRFTYDSEAVHDELLAEAFAAARRKAERLAAAAARQLGGVVAIEESGPQRVGDERMMAVAAHVEAPEVRPREQTVTAQLTVVFGLEP